MPTHKKKHSQNHQSWNIRKLITLLSEIWIPTELEVIYLSFINWIIRKVDYFWFFRYIYICIYVKAWLALITINVQYAIKQNNLTY